MDVHRSRFVPIPTSAISALAFSRTNDVGYLSTPPALRLALGRANGDIEIWNPLNGLWLQEQVFPGDDKSIDGLAWTQERDVIHSDGRTIAGQQRLFSIASSPAVTEWDLELGVPKRRSTGNFSEVWCFAAQPRWRPQKSAAQEDAWEQDLIAGCGDGTVVLLSTADGDLQFKRYLARVGGKKARCMCVTYQNSHTAVAGFADSFIRVYDTRNGSLLRSMGLGVGIPGAPKNALVWQVKCLPNGDIVSADSNGEIRFWDARNHTLLQRLAGHEADCLDLAVNHDGRTIFSGSIDGRVAVYRQSVTETGRKAWARIAHRRCHDGEVKALTPFDSKGTSVVLSGGSDLAPIAIPLRQYGKENIRSLPGSNQQSPVLSAPRARLLVCWWDRTISIWRIAKHALVNNDFDVVQPRKLVAKITLSTKQKLRDVSISPDGRVLAAATNTEVKIFQLRKRVDAESLAIRKLLLPSEFETLGARLVTLSPDTKWVAVVTPDDEVHVARISSRADQPKLLQILDRTVELERRSHKVSHQTGLGQYERVINKLVFSSDSAVMIAGDISGSIDSWVLEGREDTMAPAVDTATNLSDKASSIAGSQSDSDLDDSDDSEDEVTLYYGQHWTINPAGHLFPKLDSAPLVMAIRPTLKSEAKGAANGNPGVHATRNNPHAHSHELPQGQHKLFVMTARHAMFEFDVFSGRLSNWSRRNPTAALPEEFKKVRDRAIGAIWDVSTKHERIWIYGPNWMFMLNVGVDLDNPETMDPSGKRKRRSGGSTAVEDQKRWKANSGAGGKTDRALAQPFSTSVQTEGLCAKGNDVDVDDDDESEADDGLQLTRYSSSEADGSGGGHDGVDDDEGEGEGEGGDGNGDKPAKNRQVGERQQRKWWITFKYRPIVGVVALEDENGAGGEDALEVVVVERPSNDSV